jgi:hypothetical protein
MIDRVKTNKNSNVPSGQDGFNILFLHVIKSVPSSVTESQLIFEPFHNIEYNRAHPIVFDHSP